jgi:hypothetical protein
MNDLIDYVREHTYRGECQCGSCCDKGDRPEPTGHTADMVFFPVGICLEPDTETFCRLTREYRGEYQDLNPLDGKTHGYLSVGAWIGDQGDALRYMALGVLLGVFSLKTPMTVLRMAKDDPQTMELAGNGFVAVQAVPQAANAARVGEPKGAGHAG